MTTQQDISSYTSEEINTCRNSILFTLRALGTGAGLLELSDEAIEEALENDELLLMYIQILKMLVIDEDLEVKRAQMRKDIMCKIIRGLVVRNHPDTQALVQSPVDYDALPEIPGFSAKTINSIHPVRAKSHSIH
jgi:hypothetical protein